MYDVLLKFASATEAKSLLPTYTTDGVSWDQSNVIPDVKVWYESQSTVTVGNLLGVGLETITTPLLLKRYFTWISVVGVPKEQTDMTQMQLCYNRDALNARQPKSIYKASLTVALLDDIRASPVYQGADIPWGSLRNYM